MTLPTSRPGEVNSPQKTLIRPEQLSSNCGHSGPGLWPLLLRNATEKAEGEKEDGQGPKECGERDTRLRARRDYIVDSVGTTTKPPARPIRISLHKADRWKTIAPIRMHRTRVSNEAHSSTLLSLCPLVLVTANQIPSRITSKMPKETRKTAAKPSGEGAVG